MRKGRPRALTEDSFMDMKLYKIQPKLWKAVLERERSIAYGSTPAKAVSYLWRGMIRVGNLQKRILRDANRKTK